ncbi:SIR2 family protein [Roseibium sp. RP-7]
MAFPDEFDPTVSILFLGAGFSRTASNRLGMPPPIGKGLEIELKKLCELPSDDPSGIQDLSAHAVSNNKDLFGLLNNIYTVSSISDVQEEILSQKWLRIYTTNYDDIVEFFWKKNRLHFSSYSLDDTPPNQLRPGSVVHLHGYIHKCTESEILKQLILSHYSYAQQRAITSPWWDIFERDIRVAKNIFFLGYELNDFEPASYLSKIPSISKKVHFILTPTNSPVIEGRLREYGERHSFAVEGFAEKCRYSKIKDRPEHANSLRAFRFLELLKDNKTSINPTPVDIQYLFAFGKFQIQRLLSTFPNSKYILVRKEELHDAVDSLRENKTLILHSKIGNGKTIFRQSLLLSLAKEDYLCFEVREDVDVPGEEIDYLSNLEKVVLVFPSYDSAYSNMHLFASMKESSRFIVEMATGTLQVRFSEVSKRLVSPQSRIDLNKISQSDINVLYALLDQAGIAPKEFKSKFSHSAEFRDIVLSVFENPNLVKKIDNLVEPLVRDSDAKLVLLCSSILKALGLNTDPSFLRAISKVDAFAVLNKLGEGAFEFVDFSHDRVEPHSSIFSEFLIRRYLKPYELAGAIFRMASEAARRKNEDSNTQSERVRFARAALGGLLRFSFLDGLLNSQPDRASHIQEIFESGRRDIYISREPLFWLQYSIFMQDCGEWSVAERHLETAYKRAEENPGFLTYQLDTNYLGLCFEMEMKEPLGSAVVRIETIIELTQKSKEMISEGNHRGHVLKVLNKFENFLRKRGVDLSKGEAVSLTFNIELLISELENLSIDEKVEWGSEETRLNLINAKSILTSITF